MAQKVRYLNLPGEVRALGERALGGCGLQAGRQLPVSCVLKIRQNSN